MATNLMNDGLQPNSDGFPPNSLDLQLRVKSYFCRQHFSSQTSTSYSGLAWVALSTASIIGRRTASVGSNGVAADSLHLRGGSGSG